MHVLDLPFLNYLWVVWLVSSLALVRVYFFVFSYRTKIISKPSKSKFNTPQIIFQITTKGNIPVVQETINRVHSVCQEIDYKKYTVWVVTDAQETFTDSRTIVVPKTYTCNAIHKGRALQYAVEVRKTENLNTKDFFIFHLDDESLITKDSLCNILSFLEDSPTPLSEGLIIYPIHEKDKIVATNLLDSLRPFCCFECLHFMNKGQPAYIHGSNLLARSDVEQEIGWANGKTIAEDSLFAVIARAKLGEHIFGWHGGVIEEKSPLSLRDFAKQRQRWFYGLVQNLKFLSFRDKVSQSVRAIVWSLGFFSGSVSIVALVIPQAIPDYLRIAFFITTFLWFCSYQIGAFFNGRYLSFKRRAWFHFLVLASSFFLGIVESVTPMLALLKPPKTFEVVKKQ